MLWLWNRRVWSRCGDEIKPDCLMFFLPTPGYPGYLGWWTSKDWVWSGVEWWGTRCLCWEGVAWWNNADGHSIALDIIGLFLISEMFREDYHNCEKWRIGDMFAPPTFREDVCRPKVDCMLCKQMCPGTAVEEAQTHEASSGPFTCRWLPLDAVDGTFDPSA